MLQHLLQIVWSGEGQVAGGVPVVDKSDRSPPSAKPLIEQLAHRQHFALEHGLTSKSGEPDKVELRPLRWRRSQAPQGLPQQLRLPIEDELRIHGPWRRRSGR